MNLPARSLPLRTILALAVVVGSACFFLNNLAVWSGVLHPPPGYVPRYAVANLDVPIYLTWMNLAPSHWLLPNLNAPWRGDAALVSPLVLTAGKLSHALGLTPVAGFQIFHYFLYVWAAFVLGVLLWTFCPTPRQRLAAAIAIVASLPLPLLALGWTNLVGQRVPILWLGLVQYSYETADGLLRGGASNSFTLSFGTAANLLAVALVARYVLRRQPRDLALLAITAFSSAFFHPVEVCVIVSASVASFALLARRERQWSTLLRPSLAVGTAAFCGLLPYLIQTSRSEWVRDISRLYQWQPASVLWVPLVFGIPTILVAYFVLLRYRLPNPVDEVLRTWFLVTVALLFVPGIPFKLHMFDGFPYVTAVLLVRLLASHVHVRTAVAAKPRLVPALAVTALALSLPGYVALYQQLWKDGRAADAELLVNAVSRQEEPRLIDWFRRHAPPDQLVMSPVDLAPWIATAPIPSLASHDLFSVNYEEQSKFVGDFYAGHLTADQAAKALDHYGVRYVVVPATSAAGQYLRDATPQTTLGPWTVYQRQSAVRPAYPGLATLRPDLAKQFDLAAVMAGLRHATSR